MRTVLAVSRQYGAGGRRVAEGAAQALGWKLVDREIVEQAAARVGMDPELAQNLDERTPSLIEDMGLALAAAHPELGLVSPALDDRVLAEGIKRVVESLYAVGGYVILGRGAQAILRDAPGACSVQVVGTVDDRAKHVAEWQNLAPKAARESCKHHDAERAAFLRRFFGADINDPLLYDVVVNTSRMSFDTAIASLLAVVRS